MNEQCSGWVTFAGVLLLIGGVLNVIYGIAAIGATGLSAIGALLSTPGRRIA